MCWPICSFVVPSKSLSLHVYQGHHQVSSGAQPGIKKLKFRQQKHLYPLKAGAVQISI